MLQQFAKIQKKQQIHELIHKNNATIPNENCGIIFTSYLLLYKYLATIYDINTSLSYVLNLAACEVVDF